MQNALWKWIVLVVLVAASAALVLPVKDKVRLGLDLKGGDSFTLELDLDALEETIRARQEDGVPEKEIAQKIEDARKTANETALEIIRNRIDSSGGEEPVITRGKDGRIYVQIPGIGVSSTATAEEKAAAEAKRNETRKKLKDIAFLEFRLVQRNSYEKAQRLLDDGKAPYGYKIIDISGQKYYIKDTKVTEEEDRGAFYSFGNPDPGYVFMLQKAKTAAGSEVFLPCFVGRRPLLTGENLSKSNDQMGMRGYEVNLSFDAEGRRKFADITGKNVNRQLAIIMDNLVYSAPNINERIDGNASISGSFTMEEARFLSNILNSGAMPAPLKIIAERSVNPTLGADSILGAKNAIVWGTVTILIFLGMYYRFLGLGAIIALVLNFVLLPLCAVVTVNFLGLFVPEATISGAGMLKLPVLTLPGIAGMLLTIGMAVDANVLIYERTREEQMKGRPPFASIMAGYERAFLAIFDGNLTTVITAVVLFMCGTGLIRGFSVTLIAGIMASMFTALVVTKMFFRATVKETRAKPFKMMQIVRPETHIDFLKYSKKAIIFAIALIVVTNIFAVVKGVKEPTSVFAVDFTGGTKVTYLVENRDKAELPDIRDALFAANIEATTQYQTEGDKDLLEINTVLTEETGGNKVSELVKTALTEKMPDAGFILQDEDSVGSQIGSEMKKSATLAIILSTIAMLIYIAFRFEFGFSIGAIAALVHDVLVTIGLFVCFGLQFNLTIVAALLTIVGYGVNDTIVLFDRIREELKKDSKLTFSEIVNNCINITLSRTILTSFSTLIPIVALLLFTTGDIFSFAACMMIGVVFSTFSSFFIASPVMLAWYRYKRPSFETK